MAKPEELKLGGVYSRTNVETCLETCSICRKITPIRLISKRGDNAFNYVCAICGIASQKGLTHFGVEGQFAEKLLPHNKFATLKKLIEES